MEFLFLKFFETEKNILNEYWSLKLNDFHFVDFCLDAKLKFDDNAEFRQKAIFNERDLTQEDPLEVEAFKYDLNYIALDGKIFP